jgi:SOS-response transcriptional repressor LexA
MTPRQKDLLDFMVEYSRANGGLMPTYRECMYGLGLRSTAAISMLMSGLEDQNYITKTKQKRRGVKVLFTAHKEEDWRGIALALFDENKQLRDRLKAANAFVPAPVVKL